MNNTTRKLLRVFLIMLGSLFLGIILHELYHVVTLTTVTSLCLDFGGNMSMYVNGTGDSSEVVGHIITIVVTIAGSIFGIKDYYKN